LLLDIVSVTRHASSWEQTVDALAWDLSGGVLPSMCGLTVASEVMGEVTQDGPEALVVEADDR